MNDFSQLSLGQARARLLQGGSAGDPRLPALADLLYRERAANWLRRRLGSRSPYDPEELTDVTVLRYRPGKRCTLRMDFSDRFPGRLYLKVFRPRKARRVEARLRTLGSLIHGIEVHVPAIVALIPEDGVLVLEEIPGTPLDAILETGSGRREACGLAARGLARLHSTPVGAGLSPIEWWTRRDELDAVARQCWGLSRHPEFTSRRAEDLLVLAGSALEGAAFSAPVLLHRDLHPQQLFLNGSAVGFVDLDDIAVGAAEIDLGNLLAHLDLFGLFQNRQSPPLDEAAHMLESEYCAARPLSRQALLVARGASLLRLAGVYAGSPELVALVPLLVHRAQTFLDRGATA